MSTVLDERPGINTWCMGHTSIYFVYGYFYSWNNITSLENRFTDPGVEEAQQLRRAPSVLLLEGRV